MLCENYPRCGDTTAEYLVTYNDHGTTKTEYLGSQCLDEALRRDRHAAYRSMTTRERQ